MSKIKVYYDLHIHTDLSPCGQGCMVPNNIIKKAIENNLDIIAICDHNSVKQLINFDYLQSASDIIIVPGVEMTVSEGYHVVCLFPNFINAYEFGNKIIEHLNPNEHDLSKLGHQNIYDYEGNLLHEVTDVTHQQFTKMSVHLLRKYVNHFDGIMILGHIERYDPKIYNEVQTIFNDCFDAIEINARSDYESIIKEHSFLLNHILVRSTDAHDLNIIGKNKHYFELDNLSIASLISYFKNKN